MDPIIIIVVSKSENNYPVTRRHISEERKHQIHHSYPDEFHTSNC